MNKNNPPKKLRLFKKTIAHLNLEQMYAARGGDHLTQRFCGETDSFTEFDCDTAGCQNNVTIIDCQPTLVCG
jgi:hypothetical protein